MTQISHRWAAAPYTRHITGANNPHSVRDVIIKVGSWLSDRIHSNQKRAVKRCPFHICVLPFLKLKSKFKIKFEPCPQALPESGSLRLTTAGRGGLSDVYLYELTSGEALMRDALTLPGSMALEAALVRESRFKILNVWMFECWILNLYATKQ